MTGAANHAVSCPLKSSTAARLLEVLTLPKFSATLQVSRLGFPSSTDRVVSAVGWGNDATEGKYWIVRNSGGEFWREQEYIRVKDGWFSNLALGQQCAGCAKASMEAMSACGDTSMIGQFGVFRFGQGSRGEQEQRR